jgi:hypothetical protein
VPLRAAPEEVDQRGGRAHGRAERADTSTPACETMIMSYQLGCPGPTPLNGHTESQRHRGTAAVLCDSVPLCDPDGIRIGDGSFEALDTRAGD